MPNSRGTGVCSTPQVLLRAPRCYFWRLKLGVNVGLGATYIGINFVKEFAQICVVFEEFTYADTQRHNRPQLFFPISLSFRDTTFCRRWL